MNDFTLEKYKDAQTSPTMFGDRGATWDVNPQYDPAHPLFKDFPWVTIEALNIRIPKPFVEEFLKDPTDCKTKYMCEPPPQIGGFFEIPTKLDECVDRELPGVIATPQLVKRTVREMDFAYVSMLIDQIPPRQEGCSYFLHGDPGLVSDAFSICVCHTLPESKWVVDLEGEERQLDEARAEASLSHISVQAAQHGESIPSENGAISRDRPRFAPVSWMSPRHKIFPRAREEIRPSEQVTVIAQGAEHRSQVLRSKPKPDRKSVV